MSIKIMTYVWGESPYEAKALLVHLALADFSNDQGECWPSQGTIAHKARCSVRYVRTVIEQMVQDGQIEVVHQGGNGKGDSSKYRLIPTGKSVPPSDILGGTGKQVRGNTTTSKGELDDTLGGTGASIEPSRTVKETVKNHRPTCPYCKRRYDMDKNHNCSAANQIMRGTNE